MGSTMLLTAATAVLVSMGMPVAAQMDPVMLGQGQTLNAAIRAQAKAGSSTRAARPATRRERPARTCATVPIHRARLGAGDPTVIRMTAPCRNAGY